MQSLSCFHRNCDLSCFCCSIKLEKSETTVCPDRYCLQNNRQHDNQLSNVALAGSTLSLILPCCQNETLLFAGNSFVENLCPTTRSCENRSLTLVTKTDCAGFDAQSAGKCNALSETGVNLVAGRAVTRGPTGTNE